MSNSPANSGWGIANGKTLLPLFAIRHSLLAHFLVPATHGARGLNLPFIHPEGWRSAEDGARVQRHPQRAVTRHARRLRGALRPSAEGRAPLGAPPWRFSAGARASISGISSGSVQRAPRGQVIVPGGRGPGPPGAAVTSRRRGTPRLAPPTGPSPETPLDERGWARYMSSALRSRLKYSYRK